MNDSSPGRRRPVPCALGAVALAVALVGCGTQTSASTRAQPAIASTRPSTPTPTASPLTAITAANAEASRLLAVTTVPTAAIPLPHPPKSLDTGPASFCVPVAVQSRSWRIPHTSMQTVMAYFAAHPTPSLTVQGHGRGGTGTTITSLSIDEAASLSMNPEVNALVEPLPGGSVALRVQAIVVPTGANCPRTTPATAAPAG